MAVVSRVPETPVGLDTHSTASWTSNFDSESFNVSPFLLVLKGSVATPYYESLQPTLALLLSFPEIRVLPSARLSKSISRLTRVV